LRAGIVAGVNPSTKTLVIDCPVYGGNSGGPVLEMDRPDARGIRLRIIGVVTQFVPAVVPTLKSDGTPSGDVVVTNSGYAVAVAMDSVLELVEHFDKSTSRP
jgi:hypothetical protein